MKKIFVFALTMLLCTAAFAGCGCTRTDMGATSAPTVLPTNEEVWDETHATTASTVPVTTAATIPSSSETTEATIDHGNGPLEEPTSATDGTAENRARQGMIS